MQRCEVLALSPPGRPEPALAVAACRAGARGFLDLEYAADLEPAWDALRRLERFTAGPFGVKLGRNSGALVEVLASACPARLAWVLFAGGAHADLEAWVQCFRERNKLVLLEAIDRSEMTLGERLDVDGLVLKGHESGGRVGGDTAFLLLQKWSAEHGARSALPVWVQGGIGLNTAAACATAGAAGVVLDAQLLLTRESPLTEAARQRLASCDGSETLCLGERLGETYRFYARPGLAAVEELRREEERLAASPGTPAERLHAWRETVRRRVSTDPERGLWLVGQDAAFAKPLAERFTATAGIIQAIQQRTAQQVETARRLTPLAENSPLAQRHGTRYPIVQGPMTRVSDTPAFAEAVACNGGLPFLALALLRRAETEKLLDETRSRLAGRPWGVGILGFVPPEIRCEQMEAIRQYRPPFALIAGGRPDQARELEKEGIPTYLHVPSPELLRMFLRDGARRFIFEGRECGGHVGPRTSFVLWETMCAALLEHLGDRLTGVSGPPVRGQDLHVLFAGGIHDALSSAMVSALAAGLAERGVAVGVLLGTAYLFTEEAVACGAIVPSFQKEALQCRETVLLETSPGHEIRCVKTPYADIFAQEKRRLQAEGKTPDEIREALEALNVGRLRIASKGIDRAPSPDHPLPLPLPLPDQGLGVGKGEGKIGRGKGKGRVTEEGVPLASSPFPRRSSAPRACT